MSRKVVARRYESCCRIRKAYKSKRSNQLGHVVRDQLWHRYEFLQPLVHADRSTNREVNRSSRAVVRYAMDFGTAQEVTRSTNDRTGLLFHRSRLTICFYERT
mgnify:CR=1 FL=1